MFCKNIRGMGAKRDKRKLEREGKREIRKDREAERRK